MNNKGLTLLETLVSMLILSFGVLGLAPLMVLSVESNSMAQDVMTVSNLAKETIEFYQTADSLPTLPYNQTEYDLAGIYDRQVLIWDNTTDTTITDGLCHIQVIITWTDDAGVTRSAPYASILDKG
jgi:Tfp pilus assembly protein PilV